MRKILISICKAAMVSLLVALFAVVLCRGKFFVGLLLAYAENNRGIMIAMILGLYVLKGCSGALLYSVLVFASAFVLPLPVAIVVNMLGTVLCFSVSYLFGRGTDSRRLEEKLERYPKFAKYIIGSSTGKELLCFGTRMAGLSSEAAGIIFGLMRIPYWDFLWASLMGVAPGMLCVTVAGWLGDIHSPWFWILQSLNLLFAPLGFWVLACKRRGEECKELQPENAIIE